MTRTFQINPARRERVPVLLGLIGPSGSGKTYSALRVGTGIVKVLGGKLACIDTEARRALHYADKFQFHHIPFDPPYGPLDYLAVMRFAVEQGATCLIVDSQSHEHEGPGGVLDQHEHELDRMAGNDYEKRKRCSAAAWIKPKGERRALVNGLLQLGVSAVFCFRAQEKLDWKHKSSKGEPTDLGWQPIAGSAFVYEMTARALLLPGSDGVPDWEPKLAGEKQLVKRPAQFRELFERLKDQPLSEEMGEAMARWAAGDTVQADDGRLALVSSREELNALWRSLPKEAQQRYKTAFAEKAKGFE